MQISPTIKYSGRGLLEDCNLVATIAGAYHQYLTTVSMIL